MIHFGLLFYSYVCRLGGLLNLLNWNIARVLQIATYRHPHFLYCNSSISVMIHSGTFGPVLFFVLFAFLGWTWGWGLDLSVSSVLALLLVFSWSQPVLRSPNSHFCLPIWTLSPVLLTTLFGEQTFSFCSKTFLLIPASDLLSECTIFCGHDTELFNFK